jgi:hypothetical protein
MIAKRFPVFIIASVVFLVGCYDPPEFSATPQIAFKNIRFVDVDGFSDSLILTFKFRDGDGDLGLLSFEDGPPYHSFDYVIDANGQVVTFNADSLEPPFYKKYLYPEDQFLIGDNKLFIPVPIQPVFYSEEDNRPSVYNCQQFLYDTIFLQSFTDSIIAIPDTFYIVQNEFNRNIYIDFYRKISGNYIPITDDEFSPNSSCPEGFDSRFPIFNRENVRNQRVISGSITYPMLSQGFKSIFRNDTIQIRFFVYDRALNKSNVAVSRDFTLFDF